MPDLQNLWYSERTCSFTLTTLRNTRDDTRMHRKLCLCNGVLSFYDQDLYRIGIGNITR